MPEPESYIEAIDAATEAERAAEVRVDELLGDISKLIRAVAAGEVAYEIASAASLDEPTSLEQTATAIDVGRTSLAATVEQTIQSVKQGYRARHERDVIWSQVQVETDIDLTDS